MKLKAITDFTSPNFIIKGKMSHLTSNKTVTVRGTLKSYFYDVMIDNEQTERKIKFLGARCSQIRKNH